MFTIFIVNIYKLIKPSDVRFNFKYDGEYSKFKVAKKIALAVNQAKADGFNLNYNSWKSSFSYTTSKWEVNDCNNWCGLLPAVLLYSDCNFYGSKIEAVASLLNVEKEWIIGFFYGLNGLYRSTAQKIMRRKSRKGLHCRDGEEIAKIFKLGYLAELIFEWNFIKTSKDGFNTHKWETLEESTVFLTLGINSSGTMKRCSQCKMYGGMMKDHVFHNGNCYFINNQWNDSKYKFREFIDLTCDEITIKNLLS